MDDRYSNWCLFAAFTFYTSVGDCSGTHPGMMPLVVFPETASRIVLGVHRFGYRASSVLLSYNSSNSLVCITHPVDVLRMIEIAILRTP